MSEDIVLKDREILAKSKYVRISPFKLRRIANLVRGKMVGDAIAILKNLPHKGAVILLKVVKSAQANAVNNNKLNEKGLMVSSLMINEGPRLKRFTARARGRIDQIIKRTSHIVLGVKDKEGVSHGK
ncbi:50S ribosomal protein L22 [Candidatus Margulisiibacteriota bacterium]